MAKIDPAAIAKARAAGYSDAEIADHLSKDVPQIHDARAAGYDDGEILNFVAGPDTKSLRANDSKGAIDSGRAEMERRIANLPPAAQEVARRQYNADPRVQKLQAAAQRPAAPTRSQKLAGLEGDQSGAAGLMTLAKQGITLGLSDEAAGIGGAIGNALLGRSPVKEYVENRDAARQTIAQARKAHPYAGPVAEFLGGGGAVNSLAAPTSIVQAAKQGAGIGAISGFGYGEGAAGSALGTVTGAGIGAAAGAAGQYVGDKLAARRARQPNIDTQVIEAGKRQNIPIRQPDARPELRGKMAQVESTGAGGPLVREARAADQAAIEGRVGEIGGQGAVSDPYALGSKVQETGSRYIATTKAQANRLYDRARQAASGQTVNPTEAIAAIDRNISELAAAGENTNAGQIKYLQGLREDLNRPLSIEAVQSLRTNMRGQLSERGLTGTDAERRVGQVITAANQDLTRDLPQQASTALRSADQFYSQRQDFINGTLKQFMGSRGNPVPPETAATRLISMTKGKGNFERFSNMWSQLEPSDQADVAATIAHSLGRRSNGDFSAAQLVTSLDPQKGINPRTARMIFGDDGAQALNDLRIISNAKTATMSRQSPSGISVAGAAKGLKTLLMGMLGFSQGGPAGAVAAGAGQSLFQNWGEQRAARMLLNPDFTRWLRNAPNTSNPQAINAYFSRLASIGSIPANDNQAFVNALRSAFNKSPGAAAADQGGNSRREPPRR